MSRRRLTRQAATGVAGFARIQQIRTRLNSCEFSYGFMDNCSRKDALQ